MMFFVLLAIIPLSLIAGLIAVPWRHPDRKAGCAGLALLLVPVGASLAFGAIALSLSSAAGLGILLAALGLAARQITRLRTMRAAAILLSIATVLTTGFILFTAAFFSSGSG